ncbi:DMT family transporter [Cohnella suwonensis]|uniref:DMT family transporter n=1 Tax=Cohnella suwonensis TaxID=696072 RepID=A0ABW0LZ33_9BACL
MKYRLSVLIGAVCYGILSTIVVTAYGEGYGLGEVVGSQLLVGFALSWALVGAMKGIGRRRKSKALRFGSNVDTDSANSSDSALEDGGGRTAFDSESPKLTWKHRFYLMAAGMPTAVTGLLYYQSLRYIPNSLAILLLFQFTWIGVLLQAVIQRKKPSGTMLLALAVLFGGTLLAAGVFEEGLTRFDWLGVAFGLLSAVSYSLFILLSGKAVPKAPAAVRSGWMVTGGMLLVFALFPPTFLFDGQLWNGLLGYGTLLGFFGAFLPPVLYAIGVPHIGEGMTGILGASELPVAVMLSAVVLHEQVSLLQWAGVALVLAGVALPELFKAIKQASGRPLSGRRLGM